MFDYIIQNPATVIIGAVIAAAVILILRRMIGNFKKGKCSGCDHDCSNCKK